MAVRISLVVLIKVGQLRAMVRVSGLNRLCGRMSPAEFADKQQHEWLQFVLDADW